MESDLGALIQAKTLDIDGTFESLGLRIGQLYTDHGFPIDMALGKLDLTLQQKIVVLDGACQWLIEHRRLSNATDKAIDRQRKTNRDTLHRFLKTGEVGIY